MVSHSASPALTGGALMRYGSFHPTTLSRLKIGPRTATSPDMNERHVAAVTEPARAEVTRESRGLSKILAAILASTLARRAIAAVAGALVACSFAPLDWWPLAVLCPAVLMWLWQGVTPREGAWLGFWFNAATFAAG